MTDSARFRERLTLQAKNLVDNGRGGRARPAGGPEWVDLAPGIAAEVLPLRGGEALTQSVLRATQLYRVTIRLRLVAPDHRLVWRGTALNIRSLAPSIDRRELVMTCEAGLAAQ